MKNSAWFAQLPIWVIGAAVGVAANALWLAPGPSGMRLAGALLLLLIVPGLGWTGGLLGAGGRQNPLDLGLIAVGLSLSVAVVFGLAMHLSNQPLTAPALIAGLDAIAAAGIAFSARRRSCLQAVPVDRRWVPAVVSILLLASTLRLAGLGYSEYQGDEIRALQPARGVIEGEPGILVEQKKGPVQAIVSAELATLTDSFREGDMRVVFALVSLAAVLATFRLGSSLFGLGAAWIAGLLLSIDGTVLAFSRVVQYQSVVLLMSALAVLCAFRVGDEEDDAAARVYLVLAAVFCAVGLLAHYDAVFVVPAIVYLCAHRLRRRGFRPVRGAALLAIILAAALLVSFYAPFLLNRQFAETYSGYTEGKLHLSLYNNVDRFVEVASFYNSIWFLALLASGLLFAGWSIGRIAWDRRGAAFVPGLVLAAGLTLAATVPVVFHAGQVEWAVTVVIPLAVALTSHRLTIGIRAVALWFLVPFVTYMFLLRAPGLHYYNLMPAWALLAGWAAERAWVSVRPVAPRAALAATGAALLVLAAYYPALVFLRTDLRYALTFPLHVSVTYPTWHSIRPDMVFFGFPHKVGWKTVAQLFSAGELRGSYATNEKEVIAGWYVPEPVSEARLPRYVFYSIDSADYKELASFRRERIEGFYTLGGRVTVEGVPRLLIYRLDGTAGEPQTYRAEDYEPAFDTSRRPRTPFPASDPDLAPLARLVELSERPGQVVLFDSSRTAERFSYVYRGRLPYLLDPVAADVVAGDLWEIRNDERGALIDTCSGCPFGHSEVWRSGTSTLSFITRPSSTSTLRSLAPPARFGAAMQPVAYQVDEHTCSGRPLRLSVFWHALRQPSADFTVFTHLIDASGTVWAQDDQQPLDGLRKTSSWQPGEVFRDEYELVLPPNAPAGRYRIELGMYDWASGERLPAEGGDGGASDRVALPAEVRVEAECRPQ